MSRRARQHRAAGGTYRELSLSNGGLRLADAEFSDHAADIVTSFAKVHNGLHVVMKNSAAAVLNSLPGAAVLVWELERDSLGNRLSGPVNLTERDNGLWILERYTSAAPCLLTVWTGFSDLADVRVLRQQLQAIEWGWPSTTVRRGGLITVDAGAAEVRTVGAGVADEHMGYSGESRRHTHEQESQFRGYPIGHDGRMSETPGTNTQVSTAQVEMHQTAYYFVAFGWNSNAGADGAEFVVDPSYHLSPFSVPT